VAELHGIVSEPTSKSRSADADLGGPSGVFFDINEGARGAILKAVTRERERRAAARSTVITKSHLDGAAAGAACR